jgi:hypothetical protein
LMTGLRHVPAHPYISEPASDWLADKQVDLGMPGSI